MGSLVSCCLGEDGSYETPDPEVRRQQMLDAAEKRKVVAEKRGIKNPESVRERQRKQEEMDKMSQNQHAPNEGGMRWQVG